MNYFDKYGSTQVEIVKKWVADNKWLNDIVEDIEEESTSFHDVKLKTNIDPKRWYTVEVKEDEIFWFDKTGNVGLDAISSFNFVNNIKRWMPFGNNGAWIKASDFNSFKKDIKVDKWGKLYTCDADIQLFFVKDRILKAYNNKKIVNTNFQKLIENKYDLRINNKRDYGIGDTWKSAVYLFNPLTDNNFIVLEINNIVDFMKL